MEYTVVGFAPVILAAVSATAITHLAYGSTAAFAVPQMTLTSAAELPFVLAMGLGIGVLAAAFHGLVCATAARTHAWPFWSRLPLAGLVAGVCALPAPQIMGIGYDTIADALVGTLPAVTLVAIVVFKLLSTGVAIGLGVPAGLIGPILLIGAAAGGASGALGEALSPTGTASSAGFYALIGLGAMMAGTLHAPLAALTAMLELTGNPNIIWPGMLSVIAAYGVSRVVFRQDPIFVALLRARGLDYRNDPITQSLRRVGVAAVMDLDVAALPRHASRTAIEIALERTPRWILAVGAQGPEALLRGMDLARALLDADSTGELDLLELPADRLQVGPIGIQATLQEALELIDAGGTEALYVARDGDPGTRTYGVVTRAEIERAYVYRRRG
jgi:CIC family chloride channel protein